MSYKELKAKWDKLTSGWFGLLIYIFVGYVVAFGAITLSGIVLQTDTPIVSVFSCSMEHTSNSLCELSPQPTSPNYICGQNALNYDNSFGSYWKTCGSWYADRGYTQENFRKWIFPDGFSVGDMLIVQRGDYKVGDIVVYTSPMGYPIIHRVVKVEGDTLIVKGDRNPVADQPISKNLVHGKAVFLFPLLGWVKLGFSMITGIV
ncbi:MAG: S26 family signal peptidase [Candidatus Aenigmarchaeota archaeon]|nr:S26 family signal peptidase [Candidatus Aenigmarchaeota archaeon]